MSAEDLEVLNVCHIKGSQDPILRKLSGKVPSLNDEWQVGCIICEDGYTSIITVKSSDKMDVIKLWNELNPIDRNLGEIYEI